MSWYFQASTAERFRSSDSLPLLSIWTIHIIAYIHTLSDICVTCSMYVHTYVESSFARAIGSTPPPVIFKRKKKNDANISCIPRGSVFTRGCCLTADFPQINICFFLGVCMYENERERERERKKYRRKKNQGKGVNLWGIAMCQSDNLMVCKYNC